MEQTFKDFEIIIVDDGSVDNTEELVRNIQDKRVNYYKKTNGGVSSARNFGLEIAKGKYINFFDSDDIAFNNHLKEAHNFFEMNNNADVVIFDHHWGNEEKTKFKKIVNKFKNPNSQILKQNFISTNAILFKKNLTENLRFNEQLTISEDWDYWINLSFISKFHLVNKATSYIVEHNQRGINNINLDHLVNQKAIFIRALEFKQINPKIIKPIEAHFCSFIALQAALNKNKKVAIKYFQQSINLYIFTIFTKRSLAIIKHIIIKW